MHSETLLNKLHDIIIIHIKKNIIESGQQHQRIRRSSNPPVLLSLFIFMFGFTKC